MTCQLDKTLTIYPYSYYLLPNLVSTIIAMGPLEFWLTHQTLLHI